MSRRNLAFTDAEWTTLAALANLPATLPDGPLTLRTSPPDGTPSRTLFCVDTTHARKLATQLGNRDALILTPIQGQHRGALFLPDLSAWFKLGKKQNLRLGGGILGLYLPELTTEGFGFVYYLGGKVAINL